MLQTKAALSARFPNGVDAIIIGYVQSKRRDWKHIAASGEYETCLDMPQDKLYFGLRGACSGGHLELVKLMISRGANNWDCGLQHACRGGHLELVNLMISRGNDHWNNGLYGACRGGHLELANLMISRGAYTWNYGLRGACRGGHLELVDLIISLGATRCAYCNKPVSSH